jgi:outer membrane protein TolC
MFQGIKTMFTAAVNRIAVSIVSVAANKLEAAAAVEKAGIDAELEVEAQRLEVGGFLKQAQVLRLKATGIQADAPGATSLAALANLCGDQPPALQAPPSVPQLAEVPVTTAKRIGRPPKSAAKPEDMSEE